MPGTARRILSALVLIGLAPALAGPVEFGLAEVQRAIDARGLRPGIIRFKTEIGAEPAENFHIQPGLISGGDLRGLMYGLLEAAEQIRETGRLVSTKGGPATPVRGIRYLLRIQDLDEEWCLSRSHWQGYFATLARNRFNRFHLVAPALPYWTTLDEFPKVRPPSASLAAVNRNIETLRVISNVAAEYGLEFTFSAPSGTRADGITVENAGAYTRAALARILHECPAIRAVEVRSSAEQTVRALAGAGRRLVVEASPGTAVEAALKEHLPVRVFAPFWGGQLGLSYPPAETFPGFGYDNLLQRPRSFDVLWRIAAPRTLPWGDADFVRRAVPFLTAGGAAGFEIDAPAPREDDRDWLFYVLWGRLAFDPKAPDKLWSAELKRRFGAASADVLAAYEAASGVPGEIGAAALDDPELRASPETNPGGTLEAYRDARPADSRFFASILETARGAAGLRQTPLETAALLEERVAKIEAAVDRAGAKLATNTEWRALHGDFAALALLARFHAHRLRAAVHLARFDVSGDEAALSPARSEAEAALAEWEKLSQHAAGLWKEKLVYVRHDLKSVEQRERIATQFGRFTFAFDFGGPAGRSTVAPRFQPVEAATKFSPDVGYGWLGEGDREAHPLAATPASEWRAAARTPKALVSDALYGDWIAGRGRQTFRFRAAAGEYNVLFLKPDRSVSTQRARAADGNLDVVFGEEPWMVAGLVVKSESQPDAPPAWRETKRTARPAIVHTAPKTAAPSKPLALSIRVPVPVKSIRLHYRPLNQAAQFQTIENAKGVFTIPAAGIAGNWDLMYYFEIVAPDGSGWFEPDPHAAAPYHVVRVEEPEAAPAP